MATTVTYDPDNTPHWLKLVGDVIGPNGNLARAKVKQALFSATNPVGDLSGKVDFIICFNRTGGFPDYAVEDHTLAPRPLRGIVQIQKVNLPEDSQVDRMAPVLRLLLEETAHYWIASNVGAAKIRTPGGLVDTPRSNQNWQALNAGQPYPPYPIIGRQDKHWSPFMDGDASPFESGNFSDEELTPGLGFGGRSQRFSQIQCLEKTGPSFTLAGPDGGVVVTNSRYNHLERWIMGDVTLPIRVGGYGEVWPSFRVMEPRWSFTFPFQAGLYFEMTDSRRFYFGYDEGPHQLVAQQSNGAISSNMIELPSDPYHPHDQVGLRLVQRNLVTTMQARVWPPGSGCLPPLWNYRRKPDLSCGDIMGDLVAGEPLAGPDVDHYLGWREVATVEGVPERMGLSLRTIGYAAVHARLAAKLCLQTGETTTPVATADLDEDIPQPGPERLPDGRLMMPYAHAGGVGQYREDSSYHDAPKWTMEAPAGDFAFGGIVTLDACSQVNWAGGRRPGVKMVGTLRDVSFNDYVLPPDPDSAVRKADPLDGAYKVLFCAAARTDADIQDGDLADLDRIRRAFEIHFSQVTNRRVDTLIDYA